MAVSCNTDGTDPVPAVDSGLFSLADVAKIMSELPLQDEHLMEVFDAVYSSSGNGYDEEYMLSDLFNSPGAGVGDSESKAAVKSYSRPLRELFTEYLSEKYATKSGAADVEMYINSLASSDIQIYWPYSEDWDGKSLPIITFDPGYGAETNIGYVLDYDDSGARVVDSLVVTEELAMTRPVWVINRNDDSGFTPLTSYLQSAEALTGSLAFAGTEGNALRLPGTSEIRPFSEDDESESKGRILMMQTFCMLRNYDSWFCGASEFFVKCGAADGFWATTDEDLKLYSPSVTDFMVVVKRRQVGKTLPMQAILLTSFTSQMENIAFMIIEDDGGGQESWKCSAVVKYNSKSYGFEIVIPYGANDDIVWRGQLSNDFFGDGEEVTGRFGDVIVTFQLV